MEKAVFRVEKMDCAAEANLIRLKLEGTNGIKRLEFDLPGRTLVVHYCGSIDPIAQGLASLRLKASLLSNQVEEETSISDSLDTSEKRPLQFALGINFTMFIGEICFGIWSNSIGLVADSLDNLADASVYALSILAVGSSMAKKKRVARLSGLFQFLLACGGLFETLRRFFITDLIPDSQTMMIIPVFTLMGNIATLVILSNVKKTDAHFKASMIFTSNDILVNLLVIVAGAMVYLLASRIPDLVAGAFIFIVIANGSRRIFELSK